MINDYYLEYILDINDYLDVYICSHRDDVRFVADGLSQRSGEHRDLVVWNHHFASVESKINPQYVNPKKFAEKLFVHL